MSLHQHSSYEIRLQPLTADEIIDQADRRQQQWNKLRLLALLLLLFLAGAALTIRRG